jgi:hypothetical protein
LLAWLGEKYSNFLLLFRRTIPRRDKMDLLHTQVALKVKEQAAKARLASASDFKEVQSIVNKDV